MKKLIAFIGTLSIIVTLSIIFQVETLTLSDVEQVGYYNFNPPEIKPTTKLRRVMINPEAFGKEEIIIIAAPTEDIEFYGYTDEEIKKIKEELSEDNAKD